MHVYDCMESSMLKKHFRYQLWLKRRNEKNLVRRTREKYYKKSKLTKQHIYNKNLKSTLFYNTARHSFTFQAPSVFSFLYNKDETINFFEKIINFISDKRNYRKNLFIDTAGIIRFTTDALMYLLAVISNLNEKFADKYYFSGNDPLDNSVRLKFRESGFCNFVKHRNKIDIRRNTEKIQIVTGDDCDTEVARQLTDFIRLKGTLDHSTTRFLYAMIIELMSNTHKHAYNRDDMILPRWYCYAEYDGNDIISFTFMDTGVGIPASVRKKFFEKIDFLGLKSESSYIVSALNGEFRTETGKPYRGKGLPKIKDICMQQKIKRLRIISNNADVCIEKGGVKQLKNKSLLRGTLYTWDISLKYLRGDTYAY